jgi:hypothetical protein
VVRATCRGACVPGRRATGSFPTAHRTAPPLRLERSLLPIASGHVIPLSPPTLPQPSHRAFPLHCSAASPARAPWPRPRPPPPHCSRGPSAARPTPPPPLPRLTGDASSASGTRTSPTRPALHEWMPTRCSTSRLCNQRLS